MAENFPNPNLLIGTYTGNKEKQSLYFYNSVNKTASSVLFANNPSYIYLLNQHIYVVEEHEQGILITLNDKFEVISKVATNGNDPCHINSDRTGRFLVVLNYSSSSIIITELIDHKPSKVHSFITHEGNSHN